MLPGVCRSPDWRGELPRWMARFLPAATTIVWEARGWRFGRADNGTSLRCKSCRNPDSTEPKQPLDCLSLQQIGEGDLVLVIGTGSISCVYKNNLESLPQCNVTRMEKHSLPSLEAVDLVWNKDKVIRRVHFPVRTLKSLKADQNLFQFDTIIDDNSFFKPMGDKGLELDMKSCADSPKQKDLLYVARYKDYKGQRRFLERADPKLLEGYTIHFYGGAFYDEASQTYFDGLSRTAEERGIRVEVNKHVDKSVLMAHICRAAGQILWPLEDNNPRAAYEGLYAGVPLFISTTAGVPPALLEQSFVQAVAYDAAEDEFNRGLAAFMSLVGAHEASAEARREIVRYTESALDPRNVYFELCQRMGICAASEGVSSDDGIRVLKASLDLLR